jgi:hypothetical protein
MSRAKSFLFYAMTLAVLCYSAWELGLTKVSADAEVTPIAARRCCTYQYQCPANQVCVTIYPTCSPNRPHICQTPVVQIEPGEIVPGEAVTVGNQ